MTEKQDEIDTIIYSLKQNLSYVKERLQINNDLIVRFLICITLAEYRLDDLLLLPTEMRFREFQRISRSLQLEQEMLKKIYFNWNDKVREKIFSHTNI